VLAVCAGLQILGTSFAVEGDDEYEGLGLVRAVTRRSLTRSVGELLVRREGDVLVGFENHGGRTELGAGVEPFGVVERGRGNDGVVDGYRTPTIWASYAHGPVLAMNPWFADEILASVLHRELEPLDSVADDLYAERRAAILHSAGSSRRP
jgi:CobQ-like glutamine amidotransferase family enzyme